MSGHEGRTANHTVEAMAPQSEETKYFVTDGAGEMAFWNLFYLMKKGIVR